MRCKIEEHSAKKSVTCLTFHLVHSLYIAVHTISEGHMSSINNCLCLLAYNQTEVIEKSRIKVKSGFATYNKKNR
jgi:hypothetical protein